MRILEVHDVSIRYLMGDFKDIGLKEYVMRRLSGNYHIIEFWADHHITFSLEKGDMLGIIGTNGAGKSTLLKAVSGIMEPTGGYVQREGNIAALLELASGFDGDLTVRENTYLRGAMLGYTRKFMDEKYPEIIEFAELVDFQDRPFKQLSSGMMSRLAFSVASLVHPDILILDEVLSVGDGAFRKKSENKMREIIDSGVTTILVSHSVEQIREMCNKVLWLDHGEQIAFSDDVVEICNLYQQFLNKELTKAQIQEILHTQQPQTVKETIKKDLSTTCSVLSPQTRGQEWSFMLFLGLFLLNLLFLPIFFSSVLFIFHIPISMLHFPLAFAVDILLLYYFTGGSKKRTLIVSVIGAMLAVAAVVICMQIYDWSWDGNGYHKSITGLLRYGWNPLYETCSEHGRRFFSFVAEDPVYNAMTKGTETWAACVYVICNAIESGKAFNLISMIGSFCICFGLLAQTKRIKPWQSFLCIFFCIVNSVSVVQCFTYYVDGILWQMITVCLAALLYFTFYEEGEYRNICGYLIFLTINVGLNIKMSGLIYFGVLGVTFFAFWMGERLITEGNTANSRKFIRKRFTLLAVSAISGVIVTGVTSYVANTVRYKNPLYTIFGNEGNINTYQVNLPLNLVGMSKIQQFFVSLFSQTNGSLTVKTIEWKLPFLFDASEVGSAQGFDTRIAGWGIFFSGLFIIGASVVIWWLMSDNASRRGKKVVITLLLVYLVSLCCVPGLYWARYNLAMFYIPAAGMFILFSSEKDKNRDYRHFLAGVSGAVLLLNMMPSVQKTIDEFKKYDDYNIQLANLCEKMKENKTEIGTPSGYFDGRLFSLVDLGVTEFNYVVEIPEEAKDGSVFPPYGIDYKFISGLYAADTMEDLLDWIIQGDYITLIAVKDEGSSALTEGMVRKAQALGLDFDLVEDGYQKSYCAVIDGKTVIHEEISAQRVDYGTELNGHSISLTSAGYEVGNFASIQVDGVEYALSQRGLNITLIDRKTWEVVDSVFIDSYQDNKVHR